jgi:hypothetical protein
MPNRVIKSGRWTRSIGDGSKTPLGKSLSRAVNDRAKTAVYQSYAVGGVVKRTGLAKVHKNEIVIPAKAAKMLKRIMKK